MKMFEDKKYTGPLGEFLENCKPHRIESIYNKEYRYIKQIIWDDELNEKFGSTREGYEKFKNDRSIPGNMSYGGEIDLRIRYDRDSGLPLGYMTETKLTSNESYKIMQEQFDNALKKTKEILDVKDEESFMYWLNNERPPFGGWRRGANETISAIQHLEKIIKDYNEDEEFKSFLDKIKQ
jgi:hypothetical protein